MFMSSIILCSLLNGCVDLCVRLNLWCVSCLCRGKNIYEILTGVKAVVSKKIGDLRIKDANGDYGYEVVKQSPDSRDTLTKILIFPAETTHSSC